MLRRVYRLCYVLLWPERTKCVQHNDYYVGIRSQSSLFDTFRFQAQKKLINIVQTLQLFMLESKQTIQNPILTNEDKINRFRTVNVVNNLDPDFASVQALIQERLTTTDALRKGTCSTPNYLNLYYNQLITINQTVARLKLQVQFTNNKVAAFTKDFNFTKYKEIKRIITTDSQAKVALTQLWSNLVSRTFIQKQKSQNFKSNYTIQEFLLSKKLLNPNSRTINRYYQLYQQTNKSIYAMCQNQNNIIGLANASYIQLEARRQDLILIFNQPQALYFKDRLQAGINSLENILQILLSQFLKQPICQSAFNISTKITESLEPTLQEFTFIQQFYIKSEQIWNNHIVVYQEIITRSLNYQEKFQILQDVIKYKQFIASINEDANAVAKMFYDLIKYTTILRDDVSNHTKNMKLSLYVSLQEDIQPAINLFSNTVFTLHYSDVFPRRFQERQAAMQTCQKLSFEIIQLNSQAVRIKNIVRSIVYLFLDQQESYRKSYATVLDQLVSLKSNYSYSQLKAIQTKLVLSAKQVNTTLFPLMNQSVYILYQDLQDNLNIKNRKLRQIYLNNLITFERIIGNLSEFKDILYGQIQQTNNQIQTQLSSLDSTALNNLNYVGQQIGVLHQDYVSRYQGEMYKILIWRQSVQENYINMFNSISTVETVIDNINTLKSIFIQNITTLINNFNGSLNQEFYSIFINEDVAQSLMELPFKIVDSQQENNQIKQQTIDQINDVIDSIESQKINDIQLLHKLLQEVRETKTTFNQSFSVFKQKREQLMQGISLIKQLSFTNLTQDLSILVQQPILALIQQLILIEKNDLSKIKLLSNQKYPEKLSRISLSLRQTYKKSKVLTNFKFNINKNLQQTLLKIKQFKQTSFLIIKFIIQKQESLNQKEKQNK